MHITDAHTIYYTYIIFFKWFNLITILMFTVIRRNHN